MNFYNPYYMPYSYASRGLFSNLFRGINFTSILNGAQRTLNVVNQAIPVVKEISPMVKNAKTMFKVMNEFNRDSSKTNNKTNDNLNSYNNVDNATYTDGPTFFK